MHPHAGVKLTVKTLEWGTPVEHLQPPFDVVVACDVMYIAEAVPALVKTLADASAAGSCIYIAHGRNQQARMKFMKSCAAIFSVQVVDSSQLDEVYQSTDVEVLLLMHRKAN